MPGRMNGIMIAFKTPPVLIPDFVSRAETRFSSIFMTSCLSQRPREVHAPQVHEVATIATGGKIAPRRGLGPLNADLQALAALEPDPVQHAV